MSQFHFKPHDYLELMHQEVPDFEALQERVATVTEGIDALRILELGTGTGETSRRVLARHPRASLTGLDISEEMLAVAATVLPFDRTRLVVQDLKDPLPEGPFELAVSALAVHHLDGHGKADLFRRVAQVLAPEGRFVMGDVVVPEDPADAITPLTPDYDLPSSIEDLFRWLRDAGFEPHLEWSARDLAVIVGEMRRERPLQPDAMRASTNRRKAPPRP